MVFQKTLFINFNATVYTTAWLYFSHKWIRISSGEQHARFQKHVAHPCFLFLVQQQCLVAQGIKYSLKVQIISPIRCSLQNWIQNCFEDLQLLTKGIGKPPENYWNAPVLHDSNRPGSEDTRLSRQQRKNHLLSIPCIRRWPMSWALSIPMLLLQILEFHKVWVQGERPETASNTAQCTKCTNLWQCFADYENSTARLDVHQGILNASTITSQDANGHQLFGWLYWH